MVRLLVIPEPPDPFRPRTTTLGTGTQLYRAYTADEGRAATTFNPGFGSPTRFGFFGDPVVPVLYAAGTEQAAVAETLLHDVPVSSGMLPYGGYARTVMARLTVFRPLTLGVLHGRAADVTASGASTYPRTVRWAEAAHGASLDGLVWMSRLCNDAKAFVFFGDRCEDAFAQDATFGRIFAAGVDQLWLIDLCAPLHVDVLLGD